jgi:uncharacterized membrane protein YhaH (DUF805 family)
MKGNVIGFDPDTNTGAISGHDGKRYDFAKVDWHAHQNPHHGDLVDFMADGQRALQIYLIEPEYVPPTFGQFYFSINGRISRSQFWLKSILPIYGIYLLLYIIALSFAAGGSKAGVGIFGFLLIIYSLLVLWPLIATQVKRIHDRNKPGWLILIPLIPAALIVIVWVIAIGALVSSGGTGSEAGAGLLAGVGAFSVVLYLVMLGIGIWFFVEFGCMRGTIGANKYGPDPVPHQ